MNAIQGCSDDRVLAGGQDVPLEVLRLTIQLRERCGRIFEFQCIGTQPRAAAAVGVFEEDPIMWGAHYAVVAYTVLDPNADLCHLAA